MADKDLQALKADIVALQKQLGTTAGVDVVNIKNIDEAKDAIRMLNRELVEMGSDLDYINKSFKESLNELSKQNTYLTAAKGALKSISSLSSQVLQHRKGESTLSVDQIKKLQHKGKLQFEELELAIKRGALQGKDISELENALTLRINFNNELKETLNIEKQVNKEIGLAGVGLKGFADFMKQIGFADLSKPFSDAIEKTKDARREILLNNAAILSSVKLEEELAEEIEELKKRYNDLNDDERKRLDALFSQVAEGHKIQEGLKNQNKELQGQTSKYKNILQEVGKQLTLTNLTDFAIGKVVQSFFAINKASVANQRLSGQNINLQAAYNSKLITSVDFLTAASELTAQIGFNAENAFSSQTIATVADFKNQLGLSGTEAGNLAMLTQATGQNLESSTKSLVQQVSAFNSTNKSAVSQGIVLKDVANTSAGIAVSLGSNPKKLAEAASQAARLGMSLKDVDSIAQSLLNFESSIEAELEAQLLTGKEINLAKARELALTNQLDKLGAELFKNSSDIAEFGNMNRIAQEAYAKSLGMTRDQLAKTAYLRGIEANMTEEQAAAAANVSLEDMKRMEIQDRFNKSLEKLAGLLAGPLEMIASMMENSAVMYTTLAGIGGLKLASMFGQALPVLKTMRNLTKGAAIFSAFKAAFSGPQSLLTGGLAGAAIGAGLTALIMSSVRKEDDMISPGYGKRILSSPEGTIALNNNDTIVAGTNLFEGGSQGGGMSINIQPLVAELQAVKQLLTTIANKEGSIYLDSDLVGKGLVLGSTRV